MALLHSSWNDLLHVDLMLLALGGEPRMGRHAGATGPGLDGDAVTRHGDGLGHLGAPTAVHRTVCASAEVHVFELLHGMRDAGGGKMELGFEVR